MNKRQRKKYDKKMVQHREWVREQLALAQRWTDFIKEKYGQ